MMLTVIETPEFRRWADEVWRDKEREEFIGWIAENPWSGDVIQGTGGLRKVRWTRSGMGKSGGARVIYYTRPTGDELVLLLVYAKAKFDNLRPEFLLKLKEHFNDRTS